MSSDDITDDREIPARSEVDGRSQGQGWWLEEQAEDAFQRWGLSTARNGRIWGHEIDVIGSNRRGKRFLAECKDYYEDHVTPRDVWRLVALAFTAGCRPVLAHASPLTDKAAQICRMWRVVRIPVGDVLHREEAPRPSRPRREVDEVRWNAQNPKWKDERFRRLIIRDKQRYKRIERSPRYSPPR